MIIHNVSVTWALICDRCILTAAQQSTSVTWVLLFLFVVIKILIFKIWESWLRSLPSLKEHSFWLKANSLWLFPPPYFWAKIILGVPLLLRSVALSKLLKESTPPWDGYFALLTLKWLFFLTSFVFSFWNTV